MLMVDLIFFQLFLDAFKCVNQNSCALFINMKKYLVSFFSNNKR